MEPLPFKMLPQSATFGMGYMRKRTCLKMTSYLQLVLWDESKYLTIQNQSILNSDEK